MSAAPDEAAALRLRRLELDNEDLRAENSRLKLSILQRQEEVAALGERLGQLQARLDALHRVAAWGRFGARLRRLVRRGS